MSQIAPEQQKGPQEPLDVAAALTELARSGLAVLEREAGTLAEQAERGELDHERLGWFFRSLSAAGPLSRLRARVPDDDDGATGNWQDMDELRRSWTPQPTRTTRDPYGPATA